MLLLQCLAQQILISLVLRMQWFLEAQESHVPVIEHGVLRLLYVSVDLDMRTDSHSVLVRGVVVFVVVIYSGFCPSECQAGRYRSQHDATCQQCPQGNTEMDQVAASECSCLNGYFRNNESTLDTMKFENPKNETPDYDCTSK